MRWLEGRRRRIAAPAMLAWAFVLAAGGAQAPASPRSLYSGPGPRPGPDVLYRAPAVAPQLTNSGIWHAPPILISGASAYRNGEFLYQDFLYDDHGARGSSRDSRDPRALSDLFSPPNGTYTYPQAGVYANNAADLVELRLRPLEDATAFRITLNTMKDPSLVATTIAIGDSASPRSLPHGAGAHAPAQMFLTVHGATADLVDAATGQATPVAPTVTVDTLRRQIEVRVPHSDWDPTGRTVRLAAGVGLWDKVAGAYLVPGSQASTERPGGAGGLASPTAIFNAAFRYDEPRPTRDFNGSSIDSAWWQDKAQGGALAGGDLSPFHANVDFAKLAAKKNDDMPGHPGGVPQTGAMDRILQSHRETQQGTEYTQHCLFTIPDECEGALRGRLQPYAVYIPEKTPSSGYGLTLLLHSLSANYNQYLGSRHAAQFGERGTGSIVITPEARGPDGYYFDAAAADVFEVWADVASRYPLDPAYTAIAGYSMGGYGTYKLASQYPDLFARGQPTVGPPSAGIWLPPAPPTAPPGTNTYDLLPSLRNVPFMIWNGALDELVPLPGPVAQARRFGDLGYRYVFDLFPTADHLRLAENDQYQPAADFLGEARVDRDPAHVTYVVNPKMDFAGVGTVADHAYWVSGLRLRNTGGDAPRGTIDVRSDGFGVGDPSPSGVSFTSGPLEGGDDGPLPYARQSQGWGAAPKMAVRKRLVINARNVRTVTVNGQRARVGCKPALEIDSDGPIDVVVSGCQTVTPRLALRASRRRSRSRAGCRRVRLTVRGPDRRRVRRVDFLVGSRRVARDWRGPFVRTVSFGPKRRRLGARIRMRDGRRLVLRRTLRCR